MATWADVANANKAKQARNRQDNLQNYWQRDLPDIDFRGYEFRSRLIRREKRGKDRVLKLDSVVTGFSWSDRALMQATMQVQNPSRDKPLPIKQGFEVKVDWAVAGTKRWRNLWRLRIKNITRSASSGELSLELVDELLWFAQSKDDFQFRKGEKHQPAQGKRRKGWYAHQVAREVCRRYGIRVGKLAKGKHLIKNLKMEDTSPLKVIAKAYSLDRDETGRTFVIAMRDGKLQVTLLKRSKDLLVVGENLLEASINEAIKDTFATTLEVLGTYKHGKRRRAKLQIEVRSGDAIMRRFGLVKDVWRIDDPVASEAAARQRAKRRLAHFQEPSKEIQVELPGMPTVKRGDSILVNLPAEDYRKLVYVSSVEHSVAGNGDYTMQVGCTIQDFFEDKEAERIREQECKKAREKNRKPPAECEPGFDPYAPTRHPERRDRVGVGAGTPLWGP